MSVSTDYDISVQEYDKRSKYKDQELKIEKKMRHLKDYHRASNCGKTAHLLSRVLSM